MWLLGLDVKGEGGGVRGGQGRRRLGRMEEGGQSLLRRLVGERHAFLDVVLQPGDGLLQQLLLLVGDVGENIDGFLGTVGLTHVRVRGLHNEGHAGKEGKGGQERGTESKRGTYAKLDGNREEVDADLLRNRLATRDAGEVDVAGLNEALGALDGLQDLLGKAVSVS